MVSTTPIWTKKTELRKFCLTKKCKECMFCYDTNNCDFENMNDEQVNRYYNIMKEMEHNEQRNSTTL